MNLLCPNCQKMLTVPEQYAGQLMKCPLCTTNFTVPSLPAGGPPAPAAPPAPAFAAPPADSYGVKSDPVPAFSPPPPPVPPSAPPGPPVPAFATSPPPAPSSAPLPPPRAGDYADCCRLTFDPKWLQFVPAAALLLVFVLQFFPWVGVYVGGQPAATQGAWGAATGSFVAYPDMKQFFAFVKDADAQETFKDKAAQGNDPQFSVLLFFYLVPLFFLGLAASVGVLALPHVKVPLPAAVQQALPWKWAIVAGLNGLLLLFVLLQYVLPFSLESRMAAHVNSDPALRAADGDTSTQQVEKTAKRGMALERVQRTVWFSAVTLLHVLATAAAAAVYWVEKRGSSKPLPALELRW